jgi:uncharacterized membrane protein
MTNRQFGFLIGLLFVWLAWAASFWVAVVALVAGIVGYIIVGVLEGDREILDAAGRWFSPRR